jgi:hypothetical protein
MNQHTQGRLPVLGIVIALLGIASAAQLTVVAKEYVFAWAPRIWRMRQFPAWKRAGLLSVWYGPGATELTEFLRANIPENATVVLPTDQAAGGLRFPNLVQYYLFPRTVLGCRGAEVEACVEELDRSSTFIVRIGPVPPADHIPKGLVYLSFDAERGVYIPSPPDS